MKTGTEKDMINIQKLVGKISEGDIKYVDCYVSSNFGIFIPSVGFCQYAIRPQHTHPAYSFVLVFSKEQAIFPIKIKMLPNHYLAAGMAPNLPHEEDETDTFTRYIVIFVSKEFYETTYSNYSDKLPEQYFWKQFLIHNEVMTYIKKFMAEYESQLPGYENVLESLGTAITHQIIRSILEINNSVDTITKKFEIERTIEFMHQHFGEKLTIDSLAKIANMSQAHFIRTFKKETKLAPMEFLIRLRIDKAKKLLRSENMNITQVSLKCGFSSTSHFSSSFSKQAGITPSEYQKSYAE
ncbi:MAG: helix-turn-helix domain-containing protein [Bacillota bacterium]